LSYQANWELVICEIVVIPLVVKKMRVNI